MSKQAAKVVFRGPKENSQYSCFNNAAMYPVFIDSKKWHTLYHYFQAERCQIDDIDTREKIRKTKNLDCLSSIIDKSNLRVITKEEANKIMINGLYKNFRSTLKSDPFFYQLARLQLSKKSKQLQSFR